MTYEIRYGTIKEILTKYKISADDFYKWKYNCGKYGIDILRKSGRRKKYSKELKQLVVKDLGFSHLTQFYLLQKVKEELYK